MLIMCYVVRFFFFLMIRRPPRSTQSRSSAASDVYKRQDMDLKLAEKIAIDDDYFYETYNVPAPATASSPAPVSYTHLRAHETVLDLVCRLLLEKKKQTTNNTSIH